MKYKFFILLIMGLLLILQVSSVSAGVLTEWDNWKNAEDNLKEGDFYTIGNKQINYNKLWKDYFPIEIKNNLNFGKTLFKGAITEHTESCGIDCNSQLEVYHSGGVLIQDIRFIGDQPDNYNIYIQTGTKEVSVDDYETQCIKGKTHVNGTQEETCNRIKVGSHLEEEIIWEEYLIGQEKEEGNYKIKIEGDLKLNEQTDWQIKTQGVWLEDWAIWDSTNKQYYKLDETSGTTADDAAETIDGIANDARIFTSSVSGIINTGADFTQGNDYINFGDISWIDSTDSLTISAWIKFSDISGRDSVIVKSHGTGPDDTVFVLEKISADDFRFTVRDVDDITETVIIDATTYFYTSSFTHIVATANSTTLAIYVNGSLVNSTIRTGGNTFNPNDRNLTFGRYGEYDGYYGDLVLDEVGLWNTDLSAEEANGLYNSGLGLAYGEEGITVILNSPEDNYETINRTINFNCSVNNTNGASQLENVSLLINGTIYQTNSSGANNVDYLFTETLDKGSWTWNCEAKDNESNSGTGIQRSFEIKDYVIESETHNTSTFETASEGFSINITANSSLTDVDLNYNGTEYDLTQSGSIWSKTIQVPLSNFGNLSYRYTLTYEGAEYNSSEYYQNVSATNFTQCGDISDDFLNLTFKDEADLSAINASIPTSNFIYYLGDGTVNKTYTFQNSSDNTEYGFCSNVGGRTLYVDPYVQYKQGSSYPQRIWDVGVQNYTSTVTEQTLYLLSTADGIYVTFQVISASEQPISGVEVTGIRQIDGTTTTVAYGTTDAAGSVTFWLNPDFSHTFTFEKTGYDTETYSVIPTQSSYTITMGGETAVEPDYIQGISYQVQPYGSFLDEDTNYNFNYTISSSYWTLESYGFDLYFGNGTLIASKSGTSEGGSTLSQNNINTTNQSSIYMNYYYVINSTYQNGTRTWTIESTDGRSYSIQNFFDNFTTYTTAGMFGFDAFGRALLSVIIIVFVVGGMTARYGIQSEAAIMSILFGIVLFLDVGLNFIPAIQIGGLTAIENFPTFITFLILVGIIIREERR